MTDYDEFDYKVLDSGNHMTNDLRLSVTANGRQWSSIDIPYRHAEEVAKAIIRAVCTGEQQ